MLGTPTEPPLTSVAMPPVASVQNMESNITSVATQMRSSEVKPNKGRTGRKRPKPK
jgi:hypothetical protein